MVPWFGVSAECQSIGTIEHNASPYWQENGRPLNKTVPVVYYIFDVVSSTGLGIEGYRTCWKDE